MTEPTYDRPSADVTPGSEKREAIPVRRGAGPRRRIKDPRVRPEPITCQEGNAGTKLTGRGLRGVVLNLTPKAKETKLKRNGCVYTTLGSVFTAQETINETKTTNKLEKHLHTTSLIRGWYPKCRELIQLNTEGQPPGTPGRLSPPWAGSAHRGPGCSSSCAPALLSCVSCRLSLRVCSVLGAQPAEIRDPFLAPDTPGAWHSSCCWWR